MSRGTTGCRPSLLPSISFGSSWTVKEWPALCVHTSARPQARKGPGDAAPRGLPLQTRSRFACEGSVAASSFREGPAEPSHRLRLGKRGSRPTRPWVPAGVCASVRFSAGLDIRPNLTLGPSLSAWTRCPMPCSLTGFHPRGRPRALPSPAASPRHGLLAGLRVDPLEALSNWLALPTSWQGRGAGGSVLQECGDLRLHAKRLPRPQFSLSYLGPVSPRCRRLHFMPLRALTLLSWSFQSLAQWRQFHIYVLG